MGEIDTQLIANKCACELHIWTLNPDSLGVIPSRSLTSSVTLDELFNLPGHIIYKKDWQQSPPPS